MAGARQKRVWGMLFLAGAVLAAYLPVFRAGFVWDDDTFLTSNALIHAPDGLWRMWFTGQGIDYWPLTSSTLWAEWRWWGMHPLGYHVTNLALFIAACGLLWALLRRLAVPGAYFAALLFALHPLNVESVAWITQRKNLIALVFYLLSLIGFISPGWYWASLAAFVLAMLGKTSAIILPGVLVGVLAWQRRLNRSSAVQLAPFFAAALVLGLIAWFFAARTLSADWPSATALQRMVAAPAALWFYLEKAIWPAHLSFIYPRWDVRPAAAGWWAPLIAWLAVTILLVRTPRLRPWLYAWGYFAAALLPALGFVDFYFRRYSLVADHYAQFALLGVAASAGAAWSSLRIRAPRVAIAVGGGALLALGVLTWRHAATFRDSETLYRSTLAENPAAAMAHNNLAILLAQRGDRAGAQAEFEAAVRLQPAWAEAHFNLGSLLQQMGKTPAAEAEYRTAIRLQPHYPQAHLALADLLAREGLRRESEAETLRAFESE